MTQPFHLWPAAINTILVADIGREVERAFILADAGMLPADASAIFKKQDGIALSEANAAACKPIQAARLLLSAAFTEMRDLDPSIGSKVPMLHMSSMRRQRPDGGKALPWHQDAAAVSTNDLDAAMVLWIPMHRIDDRTPSLEFVEGNFGILPHHGDANGFAGLSVDMPSMHVVSPGPLSLGNVLAFPINAIHRTTIPAHCARTRFSIDLRIGTKAFAEANQERQPCVAG